jgi:cytochrome c oxidase cbb3-type subunit 4
MEHYTFLRQLADSWILLAMFGFFAAAILWSFRPGSRALHDDAANLPFRHDDDAPPPPETTP